MMPDFEIRINDSGMVVIKQPIDNQDAQNFIQKNVKQNEIENVFVSSFGISPKSVSNQYREYLVNNYPDIKKAAVKYSEEFNFRIPKSILNALK